MASRESGPLLPPPAKTVSLFLCGDVMTGRGVDQILPHPSAPHIFEPYVIDARTYLSLAERASGPLPRKASFSYLWGDALEIWERMAPELRIVNLETSITTCEEYWKGKGINYRMHPDNLPCLSAAKIDVCSLANNHVIDWGYPGLEETLRLLKGAGIKVAGAGRSAAEAAAPAVIDMEGRGRVILFAYGTPTSGVPLQWRAGPSRSGVNFLPDLSPASVAQLAGEIRQMKKPGDLVILSLHWGPNWGFEIDPEEREFAHRVIDEAGVDLIYGHSSHHVKGIEVYRDRPIIYGCGDFISDYEGIRGYEQYRGNLGLMYFVRCDLSSGKLVSLHMVPTAVRKFRINRAADDEMWWLRETLNREGEKLGTRVSSAPDGTLTLQWRHQKGSAVAL